MTTTDGRSQLRQRGPAVVIPTQALILRFRIELQQIKQQANLRRRLRIAAEQCHQPRAPVEQSSHRR